MTLLARSAFRAITRTTRGSRRYTSASTGGGYLERMEAARAHAEVTTDLWRKISYYVCIPAILVASVYVYQLEKDHSEHLEHLIEHNGGVLPHAEYEYLHRRVKPFPWGMNALFYHPKYNKNMELEQ